MTLRDRTGIWATVWGVLLAAAMLGALPAAACTARLVRQSADPIVPYDPFSGQAGVLTIEYDVQLDDPAQCRLGLAILSDRPGATRQAGQGPGTSLTYIAETENGAELANDPRQVMPISLAGGSRLRLRVRVPAGQLAGAGDYADRITLRLVDLDTGQPMAGGELRVPVTLSVPARAEVNIAGGSGPFPSSPFGYARVDFGEFEQGESRTVFLQVRATRGVTIRIESENRGSLRPVDDPAGAGLLYTLQFAGRAIDLPNGVQSVSGHPPLTLEGENYPLVLQITGSPAALPAGRYRDVITIEVTPD